MAIKAVASPLLLNAYQVKADGTTGDYKYILTTQYTCDMHELYKRNYTYLMTPYQL